MINSISYLVTCHNETTTLINSLRTIQSKLQDKDQLHIAIDSKNASPETKTIVDDFYRANKNDSRINVISTPLNNDYSQYKNNIRLKMNAYSLETTSQLSNYIFHFDGDEVPEISLLETVHELIDLNPDIELFWIPRINDFDGVTDKEALNWGWRLNKLPDFTRNKLINKHTYEYVFLKNNQFIISEQIEPFSKWINIEYYPPVVNAFDPQGRLFKNIESLQWEAALHERIVGAKTYVHLPYEKQYAIIHIKNIETQVQTNLKYNKEFSAELNAGFFVPPK